MSCNIILYFFIIYLLYNILYFAAFDYVLNLFTKFFVEAQFLISLLIRSIIILHVMCGFGSFQVYFVAAVLHLAIQFLNIHTKVFMETSSSICIAFNPFQ